jgi:2-polyprenyl-3-methyl-5-hydroxy-6-metoxy-1,4-benzoquinol methylase
MLHKGRAKGATSIEVQGVAKDVGSHWENIYRTKSPDSVSWYRPHLERSVSFIESAALLRSVAIIDVGGGESTLVDDLLARGYTNLTILDISHRALVETRKRLGQSAESVRWICADVTQAPLPARFYDVWHDRAVFHFLTSEEERKKYVQTVEHAVKPGGHVIVSTFGPEGPTKCSGLPVVRYDAKGLHGEFGSHFRLIESARELHETPSGTVQQFLYCYCRLVSAT